MNQEEFEKAVSDQLATCKELLFSKSDSYNEGDDKLRNFRVAAILQGITTEAALGGMLAKHIVSVYDMIEGGIENYWVGTWEEKIADSINYLLILKAMVAERYRELEDGHEIVGVDMSALADMTVTNVDDETKEYLRERLQLALLGRPQPAEWVGDEEKSESESPREWADQYGFKLSLRDDVDIVRDHPWRNASEKD